MAITKSKNLVTMSMTTLFGKLREHELELDKLNKEEDHERKKNIAFKTKIVKGKKHKEEEEDFNDNENLSLIFRNTWI